MKKNFCLPKLSISKNRWLIEWSVINPDTQKLTRIQRTFDLNRIKSVRERRIKAEEIIAEISPYVPLGYPFIDIPINTTTKKSYTMIEGLELANDFLNSRTTRHDTIRTNNSFYNIFKNWLISSNLDNILVDKFTKTMAMLFVEHKKELSNRTKNNYRAYGVSIYEALQYLEVLTVNPFEGLERKKVVRQRKKLIDTHDRVVIFDFLKENKPELLIALYIEYYCLLRPKEIRFLQVKHLDFKHNCIHVTSDYAKKSSGTPSVPLELMRILEYYRKFPLNYYVFGAKLKPGLKQMGHNYLNSKLKEALEYLFKQGLISDCSENTLYDFKRMGITDMLNNEFGDFTHIEVMNQARHTDIKTTLLYYSKPSTNSKFHKIVI